MDQLTVDNQKLRADILQQVGEFVTQSRDKDTFQPGVTPVPVSGRVYGPEEVQSLVDASLDFWLTAGRYNERFEKRLSDYLGVKFALTTNSGSSANLLAVSALCSESLKDRALKKGDEVITAAAAFPTTVNPILQNGLIPVFVDVDFPSYNPSLKTIKAALTKKTKAIILAHTLGNPLDLEPLVQFAEKHNLWLIEDCCDALGGSYADRKLGSFGHIASFSFYPAHQITMGEGGAVVTSHPQLKRIIQSLRDWGRDCYCKPGKDNTCGKRFTWELGDLPKGYDHKYIYSHAGYNLKITDMQAAIGLTQMNRLSDFIKIRRRNFNYLREKLTSFEKWFILPEATPQSEPAWFGFPITVRKDASFSRRDVVCYLDEHRIATRSLFSGNIIRQPYFKGRDFRVSDTLENSDLIMEATFWLGVYPKISLAMLDYVVASLSSFIKEKSPCP